MIIPIQNGQLPQGFCPATLQETLNGFSAVQFVDINAITGIIVSSTPPPDHNVAWLQLDSSGRPVRVYYFAQGAWLSLHPLHTGFTMIWPLALPEVADASGGFPSFDGGDANARSPYSGPMWQLCNTAEDGTGIQILKAQVPLGVGAMTAPSTTVIAVQEIGGEETHILTNQEMPPHGHAPQLGGGANFLVAGAGTNPTPSGGGGSTGFVSIDAIAGGNPATGNPPTKALGHNTLPPFVGVYFFQRTTKQYYVVNP